MENAWFGDCDNGPTKLAIVARRDLDDVYGRCYELCFGKRPPEELYDLDSDPHQMHNVVDDPQFAETKERLASTLMDALESTGDPRALGGAEVFDRYPYYGGIPKFPGAQALEALR